MATGHRPADVARILRISRRAAYPRAAVGPGPAGGARPDAALIETTIIAVALANAGAGYRVVRRIVVEQLGVPVNGKRVLRVMRMQGLVQASSRRQGRPDRP